MKLHKTFGTVVLVATSLLLTVVACGETSVSPTPTSVPLPPPTSVPLSAADQCAAPAADQCAAPAADPYPRREGCPDPDGLRLQHPSRRRRYSCVARASLPTGSSRYLRSFGHPDSSRFALLVPSPEAGRHGHGVQLPHRRSQATLRGSTRRQRPDGAHPDPSRVSMRTTVP